MSNVKTVNIKLKIISPKFRIIVASIGLFGAWLFFMGHYLFIIPAVIFIPLSTFGTGAVYNQKKGIYRSYYSMLGLKKGQWEVMNTVLYIRLINFQFPQQLSSLAADIHDLYQVELVCDDDQNISLKIFDGKQLALKEAARLGKRFNCEVKDETDDAEINPVLTIES